ncbi:MAG: enoyl-[Gammaproteobacteria bacterium]|nr:enoyl-[acyl-carrier-protein] reductase FabV [Gammaproteobacteria bacterium]
MVITPLLSGNVARNCHPLGCQRLIEQQLQQLATIGPIATPKRVLILGGSSGLGLAARLVCAFGGGATTYSLAVERPPRDGQPGSAGYYQQQHVTRLARERGLGAWDYLGDLFAADTLTTVCNQLRATLGQIDLVIYSVASGRRETNGQLWQSVLKPVAAPIEGLSLRLQPLGVEAQHIEPASAAEVNATIKVMGGEPWQQWLEALLAADLLAPGARTLAFSYIGPNWTAPIYRHGTIGIAKEHLHASANQLNERLAATIGGSAHAVVCQALITKASVFIPLLSSYLAALHAVLEESEGDEGPLGQMVRLFRDRLGSQVITDEDRLIRLDDKELAREVQQAVAIRLAGLNPDNAEERLQLERFRADFLQLFGFGIDGVDYQQPLPAELLLADANR